MKNLKFLFLAIILVQWVAATAQIQTGTPWTNRPESVRQTDDNGQKFIRQAEVHAQMYDLEKTMQALDNAVNLAPNSAEALVRRAVFNRRIGRVHAAELDIQRVNHLNPYAANLYGYYGQNSMLELIAFEPLKAVDKPNATAELEPYQNIANSNSASSTNSTIDKNVTFEADYLFEIIEDINANKLDAGLHLTEALIAVYPESALAWDLKGVILERQGKIAAATTAFEEAVGINKDFAVAWYNLARMALKTENFAKAEIFFDQALQLDNELTDAYLQRATLRKSLGDREGAIADYNAVISAQEEVAPSTYLNRGLTRKLLGDYNGSLADLNTFIDTDPDNALAYKNRANLLLLGGNYKAAVEDYTTAIEIDDTLAEAYFNRSLAFLRINNPVAACQDLATSEQLGYERAKEKQLYFCNY